MEWNSTAWSAFESEATAFISYNSAMCLVGIFGNTVILLKYPVKGNIRKTGIFVKALALLDLIACILIPYAVMFELSLIQNEFVCMLMEFLRHYVLSTAIIFLLMVATERYIAVCLPHIILTKRKHKIIIAIILLVQLLLNSPVFFLTGINTSRSPASLKYYDMHVKTCTNDYTLNALGIIVIIGNLICFFGSSILMSIAYIVILRRLAIKILKENKIEPRIAIQSRSMERQNTAGPSIPMHNLNTESGNIAFSSSQLLPLDEKILASSVACSTSLSNCEINHHGNGSNQSCKNQHVIDAHRTKVSVPKSSKNNKIVHCSTSMNVSEYAAQNKRTITYESFQEVESPKVVCRNGNQHATNCAKYIRDDKHAEITHSSQHSSNNLNQTSFASVQPKSTLKTGSEKEINPERHRFNRDEKFPKTAHFYKAKRNKKAHHEPKISTHETHITDCTTEPSEQQTTSTDVNKDITIEQQNKSRRLKRTFKLVIMFFIVTIVFMLSFTPYWLFRFGVFDYNPLLNYSFFINNCSNFFVYVFLNKHFRNAVLGRNLH